MTLVSNTSLELLMGVSDHDLEALLRRVYEMGYHDGFEARSYFDSNWDSS